MIAKSIFLGLFVLSNIHSANAQSASVNANGAITTDAISGMMTTIESQNPNDKLEADIQSLGLEAALLNPATVQWHQRPFTVELQKIGDIEDQKNTGDCWIYATLNVFKTLMITSGKVDAHFALSKNYVYFYSMVEKVNAYFENLMIERPTGISSKKFRTDFQLTDNSPEYLVSDGGEFAWMRFLIGKYGIVPEVAMPSTKVSLDDGLMLSMLRSQVLVTAKKLVLKMKTMGPKSVALSADQLSDLRQIKLEGETLLLSILKTTLGTPPDDSHPFKFTAVDGTTQSYTPKSFLKDFAQFDLDDYLSISSTPLRRTGRTYVIQNHTSIGIQSVNDVGSTLRYYNEKPARLAELVKASIDNGQAVYFGTDVVPNVSDSGVMDMNLYQVDPFLNPATPSVSLKDQMHAGLVYSDHAMAFVGYETDSSGKIVRFKVENSWGKTAGQDGYFSMSRDWFEIFINEIAVHKSLVNAAELAAWQSPNPTIVKNYDDYFGTE